MTSPAPQQQVPTTDTAPVVPGAPVVKQTERPHPATPFIRGVVILIDMFGLGSWALRESAKRFEADALNAEDQHKRELGHGRAVLDLQGDGGAKAKRQLAAARSADEEHLGVAPTLGRVGGARIVEARIAAHLEAHLAPHRLRPPYQIVGLPRVFHGHEVGQLGQAVGAEESG